MIIKVIKVEIKLKDEHIKTKGLAKCYQEILEVSKSVFENDKKLINTVASYLNFYNWFDLDSYKIFREGTDITISPKIKEVSNDN